MNAYDFTEGETPYQFTVISVALNWTSTALPAGIGTLLKQSIQLMVSYLLGTIHILASK